METDNCDDSQRQNCLGPKNHTPKEHKIAEVYGEEPSGRS
jgi:hypothetical protein